MGMRYRKSIGLGKGVRLNVGKGSLGISAGVKGAHVSVNSKRGVTTSVGAPGTGVSYSKTTGWGSKSKADSTSDYEPDTDLEALDDDTDTGYTPSYHRPTQPSQPGGIKPPSNKLVRIAVWAIIISVLIIAFCGIYSFLSGGGSDAPAHPAQSTVSTSADTSTDPAASTPGATTTDVTITQGSQAAPIDVIADGVKAYLEGQGYPVTSTRKVADHSRVECVVTVPGLSDSDGSAKPANWSDVQADLVSLAAGAQSAVPDQGDYTVLVYVQSANGDNLLAADSGKVIYDKFQTAADAAAAKQNEAEKTVYVSATGSKYHSKPDCGNMSSAKEITLSEAQSRGLTACSRCW